MTCHVVQFWTEPARAVVLSGECWWNHLQPFIDLGFVVLAGAS